MTAPGSLSPRTSSRRRRSAGTARATVSRSASTSRAPPLQFGRFELTLALLGDDGRLLDRLAAPVPLLVYPDDESRGLVRLEGTWRRGAKEADAVSYKTCPDWPTLMELARISSSST